MPNRIIKESITTSCEVDNLTADEERFFYRLIVICDDFGRMDARPAILRAKCFPLKIDQISDDDIKRWLSGLEGQGLVFMYEVDGKAYLQMATWERHQQKRAKHSKYPAPDSGMNTSDIKCNQVQSNVPEKRETRNEKRDYENTRSGISDDSGGVVDLDFKEVVKAYENNLHPLTALNRDMLSDWLNEGMEPGVIIYAIKQAAQANKRTAGYVNGILRNLYQENVRTVAGVEAREREHINAKMGKKFNEGNGAGGKPKRRAPTPEGIKRATEAEKKIAEASERMRLKYERDQEAVP